MAKHVRPSDQRNTWGLEVPGTTGASPMYNQQHYFDNFQDFFLSFFLCFRAGLKHKAARIQKSYYKARCIE